MRQLFLVTVFLFSSLLLIADEGADKLVDGKFKISGVGKFDMSQTAMSNWSAGGENSFGGTAFLNVFGVRKSGKWLWENELILEYGLTWSKTNSKRKAGDRFEYATKLGYSINEKWFYAGAVDFKTQFDKGYNYTKDGRGKNYISKALAPAYSNVSLGIEYKPKNWISLYFSPATGKLTMVKDDYLSSIGAFGVDVGDKFRAEFGASFKGRIEKDLMKNVKVISTAQFFTSYESFGNVDVDWDIILSMKINKFLSATLGTTLKYDDDIKSEKNGIIGGPKLQFKEVLGVGFAYNF